MTAGRKPDPTALKLVKGVQKKNPKRINKDEPQVDGTLGPPPAYLKLNAAQKRVWKRDAPAYATSLDRRTFGSYCVLIVDRDYFRSVCEDEGWWVESGVGSLVPHPAARLYQDARDAAHKIACAFGMNPSERSRIKVPKKPTANPAAKFFEGAQ